MKLIDKDALVAEIEKLQLCTMDEHMNFYSTEAQGEYNALSKLESFLDTLEMKEVDFHKELLSYYRHTNDSGSEIALAMHFFEIGLSHSIDESIVRKVIDLYFEACKHYDGVIKQERYRTGGSQLAIDLFNGFMDIKELCVQYILDKVTK